MGGRHAPARGRARRRPPVPPAARAPRSRSLGRAAQARSGRRTRSRSSSARTASRSVGARGSSTIAATARRLAARSHARARRRVRRVPARRRRLQTVDVRLEPHPGVKSDRFGQIPSVSYREDDGRREPGMDDARAGRDASSASRRARSASGRISGQIPTFYTPGRPSPVPPRRPRGVPRPLRARGASRAARSVLLVDDDAGMRELVRLELEREGYAVQEAASADGRARGDRDAQARARSSST